MPSPLVHGAVGYALNHAMISKYGRGTSAVSAGNNATLIATIGFSLLPDIDALVGVLMGDLGRYHNHLMNSLIVGVVLASIFAITVASFTGTRPIPWAIVALVSYSGHVFLDYLTVGRGVMAFWPVTTRRFASPVPLFYGLHWSDGLLSIRHLWTFLSEGAFVILFLGLLRRIAPGGSGASTHRVRSKGGG